MFTLVATSVVQAVRLRDSFTRRTTNDARLNRAYNHELMRHDARSRGGKVTDLFVELGVSLYRRSVPSEMGSPPVTDMLGRIVTASSASALPTPRCRPHPSRGWCRR